MNPFTRLRAWWRSYREALAFGREVQRVHAACVRHGWEDWFGTLVPTRPLTPEEVNAILTDTRSVDE